MPDFPADKPASPRPRAGITLGVRLTGWFFLLALVPMAVMSIFMANNVTKGYKDLVLLQQSRDCQGLAARLNHLDALSSRVNYLNTTALQPGWRLLLLDTNGLYLRHPDPGRKGKSARPDFSPRIWPAILGQNQSSFWDERREQAITYNRLAGSSQILVLIASTRAQSGALNRLQRASLIQLATSLLIICLAAGLVIWLLVGSPLRRLARAADVFGTGLLDTRVDPEGMTDELELLGRTFNQMAGRIQELVRGYESQVKELERSRAALAESEERFRSIFNSVSEAILVVDSESSDILEVNQRALDMFGYSAGELKRLGPGETSSGIGPFTGEEAFKWMRLASEGAEQQVEWQCRHKSGRVFWADISLRRASVGARARLLVSFRDITQRKAMETALRESESRVWDLYLNASDSIWMLDLSPDGALSIAGLNPAAEKTFHLSSTKAQGKPLAGAFAPRMAQDLEARFLQIAQSGQNAHFEVTAPMAGGQPSTWELNTILARDEGGRVHRLVIFSREITEKRRIEDELRQSRANLLALIENPKIWFWSLDRDHRLITFNSGLAGHIKSVAGVDLEPGKPLPARDPEGGRFWDDKFDQAFAGQQVRFEFASRSPGRVIMQEVFLNPIVSAGAVTGASAIAMDVSDRHLAQQKARELEESLRQAQKMEVVGQLAGGIAHDFNNLLTGILGYAEMLVRKLKETDPRRRHAESILQTALIASQFTRQLLAISRKQLVQPEVFDLNTHLKELNKTLQRLIGEHIQLFFLPSSQPCPVKADRGQATQVVLNLVANARDAMPAGGKLALSTSLLDLGPLDPLPDPELKPGRWIVLQVSDTGLGIDEEIRAHIFEPFFTTKERGRGSGLGLATIWGIVKQNGGHIGVESEKGKGSTFKVYLPEFPAPFSPRESSGLEAQSDLKGKETILLAEDDEVTMEISLAILNSFGYKVLPARRPEQALETARVYRRHIDLLLTDLVMPGMNGRELAGEILRLRPEIKVLYASGYTPDSEFIQAVAKGGLNFIEKPFTAIALARKTRAVLGQVEAPPVLPRPRKKKRPPKKRRA